MASRGHHGHDQHETRFHRMSWCDEYTINRKIRPLGFVPIAVGTAMAVSAARLSNAK
jgi:hypothetical protein